MAEQINTTNDIWTASFDTMEVNFTEDGKMVITTNTGLFNKEG